MYVHYLSIVICLITITACNNNSEKTDNPPAKSDSFEIQSQVKKGLDLEPQIKQADSLQILYYDNPDGDSLRYSRFYHYITSINSSLISSVLANLDQSFEQLNEIKKCRSEGKIYMFGKNEPLKTIYFSTRCDSCCYLYFIKDGKFLYFSLSGKLSSLLAKNKSSAKIN